MTHKMVPVTFPNAEGRRLFGVLHVPERPREAGVAIILLSPGVKARVAPHRLYNKMAARFVELGYPVLRFDFHGLGDSEGDAPEPLLADFYGAVQVGRYVGDTIAAMDWMQREHGYSRFIASGLCGGAITGLLAAQKDVRITALMSLAIPVILEGSNIDFTKYLTDEQLKGTRSRYFGKFRLWDPKVWKSWVRLFTFQSHYSLIIRSFLKPLTSRWARQAEVVKVDQPAAAETPKDNTNPFFAPAFHHMVSTSRRVLLVFAESDRLLHDYRVKFAERHKDALDASAAFHEMHVTGDANHIFSFSECLVPNIGRRRSLR